MKLTREESIRHCPNSWPRGAQRKDDAGVSFWVRVGDRRDGIEHNTRLPCFGGCYKVDGEKGSLWKPRSRKGV